MAVIIGLLATLAEISGGHWLELGLFLIGCAFVLREVRTTQSHADAKEAPTGTPQGTGGQGSALSPREIEAWLAHESATAATFGRLPALEQEAIWALLTRVYLNQRDYRQSKKKKAAHKPKAAPPIPAELPLDDRANRLAPETTTPVVPAVWKKELPLSSDEAAAKAAQSLEALTALLPAAAATGFLDVQHLSFSALPAAVAGANLKGLKFRLISPSTDLSRLSELEGLESFALSGPVPILHKSMRAIFQHKGIRAFDLSRSRLVDDNNAVKDFCTCKDVHMLSWERNPAMQTLTLPPRTMFPVGVVVKMFAKNMVAVIELLHPLQSGDIIQFQRINKKFSQQYGPKDDGHIWHSDPTVIKKLQTDDHEELARGMPDLTAPAGHVDRQFAVAVDDLGKKGDLVMWCGRAASEQ